MGEYRISISDTAKQDIRDAVAYLKYNLQEPVIAEKTAKKILDAISTLEDMPERIGTVNDEYLAERQIRGLQVKNYTAFFRIDEFGKSVEVVRVLHSRRDWATLLR